MHLPSISINFGIVPAQKSCTLVPIIASCTAIAIPVWLTVSAVLYTPCCVSSSVSSTPVSNAGGDGYVLFAQAVRNTFLNVPTTPISSGSGCFVASSNLVAPTSTHLVGASNDPAYGQANQVGMLADYGYDTARDIARNFTLGTFIVSLGLALYRLRVWRLKRLVTRMRVAKLFIAVITLPAIMHLLGTFILNNFGGLGGDGCM